MQKGRVRVEMLMAILIVLVFLLVMQFLYFQITITQVKTDLVTTQKTLEEINQKTQSNLGEDIKKTVENQQTLVDQLKTKFGNYDKDMKTVVEAIKNLQQAVYKR